MDQVQSEPVGTARERYFARKLYRILVKRHKVALEKERPRWVRWYLRLKDSHQLNGDVSYEIFISLVAESLATAEELSMSINPLLLAG